MFIWSKHDGIVLPFVLLGMITLTLILYYCLRNKNTIVKSIPLYTITAVILILEVIKQTRNILDGFDTWALPFHYCSMFVFFFPFAQFTSGKIQKIMKPVAFITGLAMSLMFYINPGLIIGDASASVFGDFGNFHTFVFHHLIILYVMLTIALQNYIPTKKDFASVWLIMTIYFAIGIPLAHLLSTNYCNFLTSNLPFMEWIRTQWGQLSYSIVMYIVIVGGTTLLTYLYFLLQTAICQKLINHQPLK